MKPLTRKCKYCKQKYFPKFTSTEPCPKYECRIAHLNANAGKIVKAVKAKQKKDLLTKSDWLKIAQTTFNKYIRLRDAKLPCISCGTNKPNIQYHAGHYRSVGSAPQLRFNPFNCHKQCSTCNNHLSGNLINYRINLVERIGLKKVEWLESQHSPLHLTIDDIKQIIETYKQQIKNYNGKIN